MLLGKDKLLMKKLITYKKIFVWLYINVSCQYMYIDKNFNSCLCILVQDIYP